MRVGSGLQIYLYVVNKAQIHNFGLAAFYFCIIVQIARVDGKFARKNVFFCMFIAGNIYIINVKNAAFGNIKGQIKFAVFNIFYGVDARLQIAFVCVLFLDSGNGIVKIFLVIEMPLAEEYLFFKFFGCKNIVSRKRDSAEVHFFALR